MSDILIPNMKMPKSCLGELNGKNDCPIVGICGIFKATPFKEKENIVWKQRLKDCPLVEIPTPHGRLIDADRLFQTYDGFHENYYEKLGEIRDTIMNAPTVIPASEGD